MKRHDQTFQEMVSRITSGELNRKQASEHYGVPYGTLCVWLGRSGLNKATVSKQKLHGAATGWPTLSPDRVEALDAAARRVAMGQSTLRQESAANPDVKFATLAVRARRLKAPPSDETSDYDLIVGILSDPRRMARLAAIARAADI